MTIFINLTSVPTLTSKCIKSVHVATKRFTKISILKSPKKKTKKNSKSCKDFSIWVRIVIFSEYVETKCENLLSSSPICSRCKRTANNESSTKMQSTHFPSNHRLPFNHSLSVFTYEVQCSHWIYVFILTLQTQ